MGEAGTREEAIELVRRTEPDLTILDLNMKGSSGVEILSTLKEEDPSRRIVILTVSDSGKDLTACIQAGADGYFLKDMEPEEFLKSVRRTLEGQTVVDASMLAFLTTTLRAKMSSSEESRPTLTGREAEVLDLIAQGCTNKVIARRLDITEGTVKGHVKHLLKKRPQDVCSCGLRASVGQKIIIWLWRSFRQACSVRGRACSSSGRR